MLIGDVVYRYSAKEKVLEQGILHMVYPRFTHCVAPYFDDKRLSMNQHYELVRNDKQRNLLIVNDVINCIKHKRTPLVLLRFKSHCNELYEALNNKADHFSNDQ